MVVDRGAYPSKLVVARDRRQLTAVAGDRLRRRTGSADLDPSRFQGLLGPDVPAVGSQSSEGPTLRATLNAMLFNATAPGR